jgi:hypothetical protein
MIVPKHARIRNGRRVRMRKSISAVFGMEIKGSGMIV